MACITLCPKQLGQRAQSVLGIPCLWYCNCNTIKGRSPICLALSLILQMANPHQQWIKVLPQLGLTRQCCLCNACLSTAQRIAANRITKRQHRTHANRSVLHLNSQGNCMQRQVVRECCLQHMACSMQLALKGTAGNTSFHNGQLYTEARKAVRG